MDIVILGTGRAGTSFAGALERVGHHVTLAHHDEFNPRWSPDLVLLAVPDDAIAETAREVSPGDYVVAHLAGSRGLDILAPHERTGSLHPLMTLPSGELGASRLEGATFRIAGDRLIVDLVTSLHGRVLTLSDAQLSAYHATAAVAANHLVALMGHVAVLAQQVGLSLDDYLPLARQALEDVALFGPEAALTGPASRGDMSTIDAHLAAIPESQRSTYVAMANAAFELAERRRSRSLA